LKVTRMSRTREDRTEVGTTGDCRSVPEAVKQMKKPTPETMQRGPLACKLSADRPLHRPERQKRLDLQWHK
jgi:hypothetical protein